MIGDRGFIRANREVKSANEIVEIFDDLSHYAFDRLHDYAALARYADAKGWRVTASELIALASKQAQKGEL